MNRRLAILPPLFYLCIPQILLSRLIHTALSDVDASGDELSGTTSSVGIDRIEECVKRE